MRVLIVDDEPLARAALEKILTANPDVERFDSANDAIEAQQRLSNENYDVMLLDISMPEISGSTSSLASSNIAGNCRP